MLAAVFAYYINTGMKIKFQNVKSPIFSLAQTSRGPEQLRSISHCLSELQAQCHAKDAALNRTGRAISGVSNLSIVGINCDKELRLTEE